MEEAELARIREQFTQKVHERFSGAPIERIEVLQYGDEPEIEIPRLRRFRAAANALDRAVGEAHG